MRNLLKSILLLLVSICTINATGQDLDIRDFLKKNLVSSKNSLIEKSISSNLCIIRQQYRLEQNGNFYGKKNQSYYGESYSLAVKVAGGMYLQNEVLFPWKNDRDYQRVNKSGKYTPQYFWSQKRALNDTIYEPIDLELNSKYVTSVDKDSTLFLHTEAVSNFGLYVDKTEGGKEGYMVWIYSESTLQDSAMNINMTQESLLLDPSDSLSVTMHPSDSNKVLGGLFIVPFFETAGRIQLRIVGMASKSSKKEWVLHLFTTNDRKSSKKQKDIRKDDSAPTIIKKK